jgi:hypothetical protein
MGRRQELVDRRIVAAILALGCVVGAVVQILLWPQALVGYGDSISAAGLALTIIGFVLTYLEIRDARNEAKIVAETAIRRVGQQMLVTTVTDLLRHIPRILEAARDGQWPRAIDQCDVTRLVMLQLSHNPHLMEAERLHLRGWASNLKIIRDYIYAHRLNSEPPQTNLQKQKTDFLDAMVEGLGHIHGRLQAEVLEVQGGH